MQKQNRFTEIAQVGFIIEDKEKLLASMRRIFGAEPDQIMRSRLDDGRVYHGEKGDFEAELIFYRFANIELEFILPLAGKSIWQDHLDAHGEGMHHLLFNVDSFEGAVQDMAGRGISVSQSGNSVAGIPGLRWAYFDTEKDLNFVVEMKNAKEIEAKKEGEA